LKLQYLNETPGCYCWPTAVGKSALALSLSRDYNGEIVSADSRQVYRFLDIGTAKPTRDERLMVPHHLIDITDPDADFSLAQYQELAFKTIAQIQDRNRLPFWLVVVVCMFGRCWIIGIFRG